MFLINQVQLILLRHEDKNEQIKMPPKKISSVVEDELEEIRKSLNFMSGELSKVAKQQTMLLATG